MAQETLVIPAAPKSSGASKTTLFTLSLAICNFFLILYVTYVITTMNANLENSIAEAILDEINDFQEDLNDPETHDEIVSNLGDIVANAINKSASNITHIAAEQAFKAFLPFDAFYIADYLLNFNFTGSSLLYAETLNTIGNSLFEYPNFQDFALYLTKASAISNIMAKVTPLTNPITPPSNSTTSVFGDWVAQVPAAVLTTLYADDVWRKAGSDCAELFTRFYNAEFVGVVEYPYGFETFNYNGDVKPVFSNIISFCNAIADADPINKPPLPN